jgi:biotin carboxyl carrier protein
VSVNSTRGSVGKWEFVWKTRPLGPSGVAQVEVREKGSVGKLLDIRWRRDRDGLWLELPDGVHGFDLQAEAGDDGRPVFQVSERGGANFWQGLTYLRAGEEQASSAMTGAKKNARVRAQMPGKILRVNVKEGATVEKGQSIMVMEAMKMENEIKAPQAGVIEHLKVVEGQAVETGADLCFIK